MNPRYEIFLEAFGKQKSYVYILFINKMIKLYTGSIYGPVSDHDEFTAFIKENVSKIKLGEIS